MELQPAVSGDDSRQKVAFTVRFADLSEQMTWAHYYYLWFTTRKLLELNVDKVCGGLYINYIYTG